MQRLPKWNFKFSDEEFVKNLKPRRGHSYDKKRDNQVPCLLCELSMHEFYSTYLNIVLPQKPMLDIFVQLRNNQQIMKPFTISIHKLYST